MSDGSKQYLSPHSQTSQPPMMPALTSTSSNGSQNGSSAQVDSLTCQWTGCRERCDSAEALYVSLAIHLVVIASLFGPGTNAATLRRGSRSRAKKCPLRRSHGANLACFSKFAMMPWRCRRCTTVSQASDSIDANDISGSDKVEQKRSRDNFCNDYSS